jgi:hypothetical protein
MLTLPGLTLSAGAHRTHCAVMWTDGHGRDRDLIPSCFCKENIYSTPVPSREKLGRTKCHAGATYLAG